MSGRQPGSMLLQVMVAMAIFSTIMTVLGSVFFQLSNASRSVTRMVSFDTRIFVMQNLFERDLTGVFLPKLIHIKKEEDKKTGNAQDSSQEETKTEQKKDTKNEKDAYPKQAFLVTIAANGLMESMRFITTNPVAVYNTAKPHCVWVEYEVKPVEGKGLGLYRTEYYGIEREGPTHKQHTFLVIDGIKSLTVTLKAEKKPVPEKKGADKKTEKNTQEKNPEEKQKKKRVFEDRKNWDSDEFLKALENLSDEGKKESTQARETQAQEVKEIFDPLPAFITFSLTLYDRFQERDKTVEFVCAPHYGCEPLVIDGLKNVEKPNAQDHIPGQGIVSALTKPLSSGLQDKIEIMKPKMQR